MIEFLIIAVGFLLGLLAAGSYLLNRRIKELLAIEGRLKGLREEQEAAIKSLVQLHTDAVQKHSSLMTEVSSLKSEVSGIKLSGPSYGIKRK